MECLGHRDEVEHTRAERHRLGLRYSVADPRVRGAGPDLRRARVGGDHPLEVPRQCQRSLTAARGAVPDQGAASRQLGQQVEEAVGVPRPVDRVRRGEAGEMIAERAHVHALPLGSTRMRPRVNAVRPPSCTRW